jgi:hypothetical protein
VWKNNYFWKNFREPPNLHAYAVTSFAEIFFCLKSAAQTLFAEKIRWQNLICRKAFAEMKINQKFDSILVAGYGNFETKSKLKYEFPSYWFGNPQTLFEKKTAFLIKSKYWKLNGPLSSNGSKCELYAEKRNSSKLLCYHANLAPIYFITKYSFSPWFFFCSTQLNVLRILFEYFYFLFFYRFFNVIW